MIRPGEWKDWIFTLPTPADCALVQAGLASFYSGFSHEGYVQLIYAIGGGITMFYDACY